MHLSPEDEEQVQQAWALFDEDGSGTIEHAELKDVMKSIGLKPTNEQIQDIIAAIDKDNDGTIDYGEFLKLMSEKLSEGISDSELLEAFTVFDSTSKGYFTEKELKEVANSRLKCKFSQDEINEMVKITDMGGDGRINFEEFVRIMLK